MKNKKFKKFYFKHIALFRVLVILVFGVMAFGMMLTSKVYRLAPESAHLQLIAATAVLYFPLALIFTKGMRKLTPSEIEYDKKYGAGLANASASAKSEPQRPVPPQRPATPSPAQTPPVPQKQAPAPSKPAAKPTTAATEQNKPAPARKTENKITLDNIAGYEATKKSMEFMVNCLRNPRLLKDVGAEMPSGFLFYGPPGTGKTLFARAIAGSSGCSFISVAASEFMDKYVGVGAARVRELFAEAKKLAPSILFIDELDAIGTVRDENTNGERQHTLNQLLVEMSNIAANHDAVMVIAATNEYEYLDPALIRPGRFDRKIAIPLPSYNDRCEIIRYHLSRKNTDESVSAEKIAGFTEGMSGADLAALVNEAAVQAVSCGRSRICTADIDAALYRHMTGGEQVVENDAEQKRIVAYHESGHVMALKYLCGVNVPQATVIGSTSGEMGLTLTGSVQDSKMFSKKQLEAKIMSCYAGRAAEEIFFGNADDVTTSAMGDIDQATKLIHDYLNVYGMGKNSLLNAKTFGGSSYDIVAEANALAERLYKEVFDFLSRNSIALGQLADALVEHGTLDGESIDRVLEQFNVSIA